MKYHILDNLGEVLLTNLEERDFALYDLCINSNQACLNSRNQKIRHGKYLDKNGVVYLLTDSIDIINKPRYFKDIIFAYVELLSNFNQIKKRISQPMIARGNRLLHNLTELNAHNIQEMFNLIPEDELRKTHEQRDLIKKILKDKQDQVPKAFLNIIKNNAAIRNEFSVFAKLEEQNPILTKQRHEIRRALMNILHIYYQDFNEKRVRVNTADSKISLIFDYEAFQVAMSHIFDNAVKYSLSGSNIGIEFKEDQKCVQIIIDMISIEIKPEEVDKIYDEGFSGHYPKLLRSNGKGIGMSIVKKLLPLNNSELFLYPNFDPSRACDLNGIAYKNNVFEIKFIKTLVP